MPSINKKNAIKNCLMAYGRQTIWKKLTIDAEKYVTQAIGVMAISVMDMEGNTPG